MANYHIGLDFGTSQTKVCLLNKDTETREFLKFDNGSYFLPSIITRNIDNTFSYGDDSKIETEIYRYFKMVVAEDDDLIQVTNEDLRGNLQKGATINDFIKYSSDYNVKSDILVILYLTYIYLFVKRKKNKENSQNKGGLLGRLTENRNIVQNTFSVSLGIPTEWNNPNHIERKIRFQSLLIIAIKLANQFLNLDEFLITKEDILTEKITKINETHLSELNHKTDDEKQKIITELLKVHQLSVFPESAAGVNYLLKTKRLENGSYATLDIGAGTADIAIFEVKDNQLKKYYCSESVEIASNDFYREYAKLHYNKDNITFEQIKEAENIIKNDINVNRNYYNTTLKNVRGNENGKGIEQSIRKIFYRKYYKPLFDKDQGKAYDTKNILLHKKPIIVFGGGANLEGFCEGVYHFFWQKGTPSGNEDRFFEAKAITDFVSNIDIIDDNKDDVEKYINLLILSLGLTYINTNDNNFVPFDMPNDYIDTPKNNYKYYYYDIQDAVYK